MTVTVVTDSAAALPPDEAERHGVRVVPLALHVGDDRYRDGDLSLEDLVARFDKPIATAAPSPGEFAAVIEDARRNGPVVVLTVAAGISSTHDVAQVAAREVARAAVRDGGQYGETPGPTIGGGHGGGRGGRWATTAADRSARPGGSAGGTSDQAAGALPDGEPRTGDARTDETRAGETSAGDARTGDNRTHETSTGDDRASDHRTGDARTGDDRASDHRTGKARTGDETTHETSTGDDRASGVVAGSGGDRADAGGDRAGNGPADGGIHVVDTGTAAGAQALVVVAAAGAAARGADAAEVVRVATEVAERVRLVATVADLERLAQSGRVPEAARWVGDRLGVRPLFEFRAGRARKLRPAFSREAALDRIVSRCAHGGGPGPLHVAVLHALDPAAADVLTQRVAELGPATCMVGPFSPVMVAHTGRGLAGLAWWREAVT